MLLMTFAVRSATTHSRVNTATMLNCQCWLLLNFTHSQNWDLLKVINKIYSLQTCLHYIRSDPLKKTLTQELRCYCCCLFVPLRRLIWLGICWWIILQPRCLTDAIAFGCNQYMKKWMHMSRDITKIYSDLLWIIWKLSKFCQQIWKILGPNWSSSKVRNLPI